MPTDRLPVPGGWIYSDSMAGWAVFVPAPPRLVALDTDDADGKTVPCYVLTSSICLVSRRGTDRTWVQFNDRGISVKGVLSEVAAKLGLEIAP